MRFISASDITIAIKNMCQHSCINLDQQVHNALKKACQNEEQQLSKCALEVICQNAKIAKDTQSPICQDTGLVVVFVEIGQNVHITDGNLEQAINLGIKQAYTENYFRKSVVDPITRENTQDNTPAVIHYCIVQGDRLTLSVLPKGFGSENMSRTYMLSPAEGIEGIKKSVLKTVAESGSNPCPPIILGIGIGGTIEKATLISKKVLLHDLDWRNPDDTLHQMEMELLESINNLNIGVQGWGGKTTALRVFIEKYPTHIAGLPLAITVQCHAVRHKTITL